MFLTDIGSGHTPCVRTNTIDGELCTKHRVEASKPKLSVLITKHVDDLKLTGIQEEDIADL